MTGRRIWTLSDLAERIEAELVGEGDCPVGALNTLQAAGPGEVTFLAHGAYQKYLSGTRASAVILKPDMAGEYTGNKLLHQNPYLAYARASVLMDHSPQPAAGVHPSAVVDPSATLGKAVHVGANAVIGADVHLADGVVVGPGSSVGDGSCIGKDTRLHANVTVYHGVSIGAGTLLHSGCVIGADGFGFAPGNDGWVKIHQLGGVHIGDRVEIGACTTVDRGALGDTVIGDGVIIDNQVQIAHNVRIGENTAIAGCTGIAGSAVIGRDCTIAGACSIVGHINIADGVHVSAVTFVNRSITTAGSYSSGTLMAETSAWKKNALRFGQLNSIARRVSSLEKQLGKNKINIQDKTDDAH